MKFVTYFAGLKWTVQYLKQLQPLESLILFSQVLSGSKCYIVLYRKYSLKFFLEYLYPIALIILLQVVLVVYFGRVLSELRRLRLLEDSEMLSELQIINFILFSFLFTFSLFFSFNLRLRFSVMSYICHMSQRNVEDSRMMISYHMSMTCNIYSLGQTRFSVVQTNSPAYISRIHCTQELHQVLL